MTGERLAGRLHKGLLFIAETAARPRIFRRYGSDLLFCLYHFAATSPPSRFRDLALRRARALARRWRETFSEVPPGADADTFADLVIGHDTAARLGLPDPRLHRRLKAAARRFGALDLLLFDPLRQPPPSSVRECARCLSLLPGRRRRCPSCHRPLAAGSRYGVWSGALVRSHAGSVAGITLGAKPADVLRWAPAIRASFRDLGAAEPRFADAAFAATHYLYVLTDYRQRALPSGHYHDESSLLRRALDHAVAMRDLELLSESLEALEILAQPVPRPLEREALTLIRKGQGRDGGWAPPNSDAYTRYHTTWTCLDALRPHQRPARGGFATRRSPRRGPRPLWMKGAAG